VCVCVRARARACVCVSCCVVYGVAVDDVMVVSVVKAAKLDFCALTSCFHLFSILDICALF
jgi:hypothetical protein